ncbi:unnamed protein product [Caenorhabditis bovis]|uniref:Protein kinase domain-containing protein n=1 Tax=Caenorhabditis bovis TaxID=2654633 RepID=A0A8S1FC92_9PELO|nr:unnamed protein product [Caenorhabditis bovis]
MTSTSAAMVTSLEVVTPDSNTDDQGTFSTVVLSDALVTQSAPSTPIHHREIADQEFNNSSQMALSTQKPPNDYYRVGIGTLRDGIFACFKPVWGIFGRQDIPEVKPEDDWEVPFDAINELQWLGQGSQGAVFRGEFKGKMVAIKKVNEIKEIEIKHLRHLSHKNIIDFYGVCSQKPCYCIIMEYCPNGELGHFLRKNRVDKSTWSGFAREIGEGMHYLHSNKVIHRDLKTPNILLSAENVIKICDFGTSQYQNKDDYTAMSICGTVNWMAPEIYKKEPCNEKVDVYSFGVVLWEMLTKEQPYANIAPMAVMYGVGKNYLQLQMPESAPKGLVLLIKQCLSMKPRNRPSFGHILQHLDILRQELAQMSDDEWFERCDEWNHFAKNIVYPSTITKKNASQIEEDLNRKRSEQLNHIKDIRYMYEQKLERAKKMCKKIQGCFEELKLKETELLEWENHLAEREAMSPGMHNCRANLYPNEGFEEYSSDEEVHSEYCRGSPYRCSQASSSSGAHSASQFSRQSSCRSSAGLKRLPEGAPQGCFLRGENGKSYWEQVRGSPARGSGYSQDSGMWSPAASCSVLNTAGQPVCYAQTIYRGCDGRWSDGRIAQRRRTPGLPKRSSTTFQRDSPARVPHGSNFLRSSSKIHRQSYPVVALSRNTQPPEGEMCACKGQCCGGARAKSMGPLPRARSPTPYDNPTELNVTELMPVSTSYDEALKSAGEAQEITAIHLNERSPTKFVSCNNPIYTPPITTYNNPIRQFDVEENANDIDLMSSLDSRRSPADDADVSEESSSDEEKEKNGNILNISMDSRSSKESEDEIIRHRNYDLMDTSHSTMMSSLERSLEIGATRSDGLSDNERKIQHFKNSIKCHRRTHSNPQAIIHSVIDETLSSSADTDSDDDAVDI